MEARRDFIPSLFKGARLKYKGGKTPADEARSAAKNFLKAGREVEKSAKSDAEEGRSWSPSSSASKSFSKPSLPSPKELGQKVFESVGELDPGELAALQGPITELAQDIFSDLGSSILPLVGTAKAGWKAGSKWGKTAHKQVQVSKTGKARGKVVQGDPEQAVASVKRLLERERNLLAGEATVATVKLGNDVAGYFVDLGIATSVVGGCVEAIGRLTLHVRQIVRDAREMKAANAILGSGTIDARIFNECPLLGAYAVAGADTSALVGFLGGDPQRHGFTLDDLDEIVRKYEKPVVGYAVDVINHSRLEVTGMTTDRAQVRAKVKAQEGSIRRQVVEKVKRALKARARA